jgi:hypothetical protein
VGTVSQDLRIVLGNLGSVRWCMHQENINFLRMLGS